MHLIGDRAPQTGKGRMNDGQSRGTVGLGINRQVASARDPTQARATRSEDAAGHRGELWEFAGLAVDGHGGESTHLHMGAWFAFTVTCRWSCYVCRLYPNCLCYCFAMKSVR